jgi:hypothetical protein
MSQTSNQMSYLGNPHSGSNSPGYPNEAPGYHPGHSPSMSMGGNPNYGAESGPSHYDDPSVEDDLPLPKREGGGPIRRGVCKFFNSQKGFGFVLDNNSEELGGQEGPFRVIAPLLP